MCLYVIFSSFSGLIPLALLLLMPLYGSFLGIDTVLRVSLLLCLHTCIASLFANIPLLRDPLIQLGLTAVELALPVTSFPQVLLTAYGLVLQLSEPIWLISEVVGLFLFIRKVSVELQEHMDDQPDKAKAVVLTIAGVSYSVIACIVYNITKSEMEAVTKWSLVMTGVVCIVLHIILWYSQAGMISDTAFISMCCFGAVYFIQISDLPSKTVLEPPQTWHSVSDQKSVVQIIYALWHMSIESSRGGLQFLIQLASPGFIVMAAVRVYGVIISGSLLQELVFKKDEDLYITDDDDIHMDSEDDEVIQTLPDWLVRPWNYPIITRLAIIFVYTQLVCCDLYVSATGKNFQTLTLPLHVGLIDRIPIGRFSQIALFTILYLLELKKLESDASEW